MPKEINQGAVTRAKNTFNKLNRLSASLSVSAMSFGTDELCAVLPHLLWPCCRMTESLKGFYPLLTVWSISSGMLE